jgi:predicted small lipoprotein YifL
MESLSSRVQVSTVKSLWSLTKAILLVFLSACGSETALTQLPPEARRTAVVPQDQHPYCDDTTQSFLFNLECSNGITVVTGASFNGQVTVVVD